MSTPTCKPSLRTHRRRLRDAPCCGLSDWRRVLLRALTPASPNSAKRPARGRSSTRTLRGQHDLHLRTRVGWDPATTTFTARAASQPTTATPASGCGQRDRLEEYQGSAPAAASDANGLSHRSHPSRCPTPPLRDPHHGPAYGTTVVPSTGRCQESGSITLDGSSPREARVCRRQQAQRTRGLAGQTPFGLGRVWFQDERRTARSDRLFGIGTSPVSAGGGNDRTST